MRGKFHVISDGSCDLPKELVGEREITVVPFYVAFNDEHYFKEGTELSVREFYQKMIDEPTNFPKSSMPSVQDFADVFLPFAKAGEPMLCICISSKFSGCIQSAQNAKELVLEECPDARIEVIDARVNTVLQGLYVLEACKLRDAGRELAESAARLREIRESGRIFFTVGSFEYLKSGGRIGKVATAAVGALGIRPVITLKDGEIFPSGIGRSRKKTDARSIDLLVKYVREFRATPESHTLDIGVGYDLAEAEAFREEILRALRDEGFVIEKKDIPIYQIGAGIGVHTGPLPLGVTILERAIRGV